RPVEEGMYALVDLPRLRGGRLVWGFWCRVVLAWIALGRGGAASDVPIDIDFPRLLWCLWVCGRRRAFPRFSSLLGKRGKRRRSAKPIVHISTGFAVTEIIRGELAIGRGHSRYTLVFGRSC